MNAEAEDDVYTMVPFSELAWVNLQLFEKTKNRIYLDRAWDYSQKNKYLDLLKSKLLPEKGHIANKVTVFLSHEIKQIRLLNDSLFLSENKFADFSRLSKERLAKKIYTQYKSMNRVFNKSNLPDPLALNYFNGKLSYTFKNLKTKLSNEKSAWISINTYANERFIHSMVWVICPDTEFVKMNTWDINKKFIADVLQEKLINYKSDSVNIVSNQIYEALLKESTLILKRKGINRLYYCDDTVHPIGNIELFSTELNLENPKYLIHDFSVTHELIVLPDVLLHEEANKPTSNISYLVCPLLDKQRINLSLARAYSDSVARFINGTAYHSFFGKRNFLNALENANVFNLFSHGEGTNGIVFSDGNLLPNDVKNIKTNAELVSLVTCESSVGKLIHGDGVKGMTEALINAGAKRVVATQWKIDEKASAILTLNFYKNLTNGMRADSALRMAKLKYINEADINERHPSFWGGIILYGEPTEIKSLNRIFPFVQPIYVIVFTIFGFLLAFSVQLQFRDNLISFVKNLNRLQ
jgi:CHAT domain-containing protein